MRLLVCGSRELPNAYPAGYLDVRKQIAKMARESLVTVVIHGHCSRFVGGVQVSVDMLADVAADSIGLIREPYQIDHAIDGPWPGAGPRRNTRMLRDGKPDRGLAFGALWKTAVNEQCCSQCHNPIAHRDDHADWCPRVNVPRQHCTGTGDMVKRMLAAGLPVRWIAAPGAAAVDLTKLPEPGEEC